MATLSSLSMPSIDPAILQQYGTTNTGVTGLATSPTAALGTATAGSLAGMSPQDQYWAAVNALGWDRNNANQYRGQQQQLIDYFNAHGAPGWTGGGMQADDWLRDPSGGEWDYATAGGQLAMNPDYTNTGGGPQGQAPNGMTGNPGALIDDPGYQFQLGEGIKALQRSAAAKGTLLTGGTLKGLERYAQNFANTAYQNAFNRNLDVSKLGYAAGSDLGRFGAAYGSNMGDLFQQQGNTQAGETMGKAGQWSGMLGDLGNLGMDWLSGRQSGGGVVT